MPWLKEDTQEVGTLMSGAIFSCGMYRYGLWRSWNYPAVRDKTARMVMFILQNASTAGAFKNDQTVWKCMHFAHFWGYDGMFIGNLFGIIETHWSHDGPEDYLIGQRNDEFLLDMKDKSERVIAGWGQFGALYPDRVKHVRKLFPELYYLELRKDGNPKHPLYLPAYLRPTLLP